MPGKKRKETLTLAVVVSDLDLDRKLNHVVTDPGGMWLRGAVGEHVRVSRVTRADGVVIGLEAEFEQWWLDNHADGSADDPDEESDEKMWAREAFQWGVKFGEDRSR